MAIAPLDIQEIKAKYDGNSENRKALLDKSFEEIQHKKDSLDIQERIDVEKLNEAKNKILEVLFNLLREAGVDLSSTESINEFLRKLNDINPDFVEMITDAFSMADIRNYKPMGSEDEESGEDGLMSKFNNLSGQVLRSEEGMEGMVPEAPAIGGEEMMPPEQGMEGMMPPPMSPPTAPQQM